jgi:hypothetical protein
MALSGRKVPAAALLRNMPLLDLLRDIAVCWSATPRCDSASISSLFVVSIFVERAPGQKMTSNPAPEGMMNVEVWSSKAMNDISHNLILLCG